MTTPELLRELRRLSGFIPFGDISLEIDKTVDELEKTLMKKKSSDAPKLADLHGATINSVQVDYGDVSLTTKEGHRVRITSDDGPVRLIFIRQEEVTETRDVEYEVEK